MTGELRAAVLDTDVASAIMRESVPGPLYDALLTRPLFVTFVTVGELLRGAAHARWGGRRRAALYTFLAAMPTISGDTTVGRRWGTLTGDALRHGRPLPTNDAWIAACCLTYDLPLATLNVRDFDRIDGLRLM